MSYRDLNSLKRQCPCLDWIHDKYPMVRVYGALLHLSEKLAIFGALSLGTVDQKKFCAFRGNNVTSIIVKNIPALPSPKFILAV